MNSIRVVRSCAVSVALASSCAALLAQAEQPAAPNLVRNPGFEESTPAGKPADWGEYTTVNEVAHSGSRSLFYENTDAKRYVLSSQKLPLEVGKAYEISVWIKTENVQGPETGATLCLEWYGADGNYLGGYYPAGFTGTTDWRELKGHSGRVPEGAANCTVICYLRQGMTGKAWWDDVVVRQWCEPPLVTMLLEPNYRGEIRPGLTSARLQAKLTLQDWDLTPRDVVLRTEIRRREDGEVLATHRLQPREPELTIAVPVRNLAPGKYDLKIAVERKRDRCELDSESWRLTVPEPAALANRASYVDEHNRLIVDGKPFFPLGMYWSGISEADLKLYAESPFNCLMPYGAPSKEQMDLAQQLGLKIIYTVKDIYAGSSYCPDQVKTVEDERTYIEAKAREFRGHPALLAWYLNDELSVEYMDRLEAHQEWMEDLDPNHPTWVVLYQVGQVGEYVRTFDAIGTDPYPIPGDSARRAGTWAKVTADGVCAARPVWMVPQVFNWACYRKTDEEKRGLRPPTLAEMRSMTWQCLAHGANGLIYYSWFDIRRDTVVPFEEQWGYVKQVAAEVKEMMPVLLSVAPPPTFEAHERPWLHWTARELGRTTYLIAVNDERRPHTATFRLGRVPKRVRLHGSTTPLDPPPTRLLSVDLEPFGVGIYELEF